MELNDEQWLQIITTTPLVSIDLVVRNANDEILLGKRLNRPAQGYWFVPGGRIRKNETIKEAFERISRAELGTMLDFEKAKLQGVYDHMYPNDNYYDADGVDTHYVVLGLEYRLEEDVEIKKDSQHDEIRWWSIADLLTHREVHPNTKRHIEKP